MEQLEVSVLAYGEVQLAGLASGAWWVWCPECEGSGTFFAPDRSCWPCVYCKSRGSVPVALEGEL